MATVIVAALILEKNKILLVHNTKHNGLRIEPPGGKRETGETLEQATAREVTEELGMEIDVGELLGTFTTESPEGDFEVKMFFCTIKSGNPAIYEPDKVSAFDWYTFAQLENMVEDRTLVPNMVQALPQLKSYLK